MLCIIITALKSKCINFLRMESTKFILNTAVPVYQLLDYLPFLLNLNAEPLIQA